MRKLRNLFYFNANKSNNEIVCYGLQFFEFVKYAPVEVNQLILMKSEFLRMNPLSKTGFKIVEKEDMSDLLNEDIYNYGDFCWVNFNKRENVENLEPMEIAELLYLGHKFEPLKSPFFDKIQNKYAYLAHDDGWFCRLYFRNYSDLQEIVANKIVGMVSVDKRRKINPFGDDLKEKLTDIAEDGLLIDFGNVIKGNNAIKIPVHSIGKFTNMDEMHYGLKDHIEHSGFSAWLVHKNKQWTMENN